MTHLFAFISFFLLSHHMYNLNAAAAEPVRPRLSIRLPTGVKSFFSLCDRERYDEAREMLMDKLGERGLYRIAIAHTLRHDNISEEALDALAIPGLSDLCHGREIITPPRRMKLMDRLHDETNTKQAQEIIRHCLNKEYGKARKTLLTHQHIISALVCLESARAGNILKLHDVVKLSSRTLLLFMLDCNLGGDINACDEDGNTPFMLALKCGYFNIALILLHYGADYKICGRDGVEPLWLTCSVATTLDPVTSTIHRINTNDQLDVAKFLLEKGVGANTKFMKMERSTSSTNALGACVINKKYALIKLLLAYGAQCQRRIFDTTGLCTSALQRAIDYEDQEATTLFLNQKRQDGTDRISFDTPCMIAERPESKAMFLISIRTYVNRFSSPEFRDFIASLAGERVSPPETPKSWWPCSSLC